MAAAEEQWRVASEVTEARGADGARTEQVVVLEACDAGALLLVVSRTALLPSASWDTLQVGEREHARFGDKALKLNHSATPSTRIEIGPEIRIVAARPLAAGEPLTFNYNTTEWRMDEPFTDWASGEAVGGFSRCSADEQRRLLSSGLVAPHVRALANTF